MFNKEKRILILCRKIDETYSFEKSRVLKDFSAETITIGKKDDILINQSKPSYVNKLTKYYFYDIVTGAPLPFIAQESIVSPKQLNTLLNDKLIRDLHASMVDKKLNVKDMIIHIIVGAGMMGFVLMILVYLGVL